MTTATTLDMHYELHGPADATPLVLLHGGLLTIEATFAQLLPTLARTHRVIAVELQGHGRTPDIDRDPTLDALAGDVVALLDELGVDRADLFGFSLGGLVALQTAIDHPERVGRLVLASVHYRPDGYHHEILDPSTHADSARMPSAADFATLVEQYRAVAPDPDHFPVIAGKVQAVVGGFTGWSDEVLRAVTAPALLVCGDTDFVRIEHAAALLELLPDAGLTILPRTNHGGVTSTHADVLLLLVEQFLTR